MVRIVLVLAFCGHTTDTRSLQYCVNTLLLSFTHYLCVSDGCSRMSALLGHGSLLLLPKMPTSVVRNWFDNKGFGFIIAGQDAVDVFVRRHALGNAQHPTAGDAVPFVDGLGTKPRAAGWQLKPLCMI